MQLVWTTDPHLNQASDEAWQRWIDLIGKASSPDGLLISGDISEGVDVVSRLQQITRALSSDVFFVLGNHDFYGSSIGRTRREVIDACRDNPRLHYLTDLAPLELSDGVVMVGDDGWGDATEGNFESSPIRLNDFSRIADFADVDPGQWKWRLEQLGSESADRLEVKLRSLPAGTRDVLVVTHVPPFREACWYQGHTTDDDWAPYFVCGQVGRVIRLAALAQSDVRFTVLCGHTHHAGVATLEPNLVVYTGASQYGSPGIEAIVRAEHRRVDVRLERAE